MSRITRLDGGLTIVTEEISTAASAAIGVFVGVGSRDEQDSQYGVSHFLEHLAFKGTDTLSAKELAIVVDSFGGDMNAFTTKEMTTFQLRLLGEARDVGIDILGRILTEPSLKLEDIDSERTVILEEISMAADEPADVVQECLVSTLYHGHSLGKEVLGSRNSILNMSRATIGSFFETYYGQCNMVVSAAGNVDHDSLVRQVEPTLGSRGHGSKSNRVPPDFRIGEMTFIERDIEQIHVAIGFPGLAQDDPRRWTLAVLDQVLGGGISSRLFQTVREEHGLCYSIYSDHVEFVDSGYLELYFATAPNQLEKALDLVKSIVSDLATNGVSRDELAIAKRYLRSQLLLARDDIGSVMSQMGSVLVSGRQLKSLEDLLDMVDGVDQMAVFELAEELLGADMQVCIVGPNSMGRTV